MIQSLELLTVGSCTFPDFAFRKGGRFKRRHFPAQVALIEDDQLGWILFDTGYSADFFKACQKWPEKLYALTTPATLTTYEILRTQLSERSLQPSDITHLFISHFHADHIAGLKTFSSAKLLFQASSLDLLSPLKRWQQIRQGFLAELLPPDFSSRTQHLTASPLDSPSPISKNSPYHWISLPGHAPGHCGLLISTSDQEILLAADAFWTYDELEGRNRLTRLTTSILHDKNAYQKSQAEIKNWLAQDPSRQAFPCHDSSRNPGRITFSQKK